MLGKWRGRARQKQTTEAFQFIRHIFVNKCHVPVGFFCCSGWSLGSLYHSHVWRSNFILQFSSHAHFSARFYHRYLSEFDVIHTRAHTVHTCTGFQSQKPNGQDVPPLTSTPHIFLGLTNASVARMPGKTSLSIDDVCMTAHWRALSTGRRHDCECFCSYFADSLY